LPKGFVRSETKRRPSDLLRGGNKTEKDQHRAAPNLGQTQPMYGKKRRRVGGEVSLRGRKAKWAGAVNHRTRSTTTKTSKYLVFKNACFQEREGIN